MTTRAGYKALFIHADGQSLADVEFLKENLPKSVNVKKLSISDVVRLALSFTANKMREKLVVTPEQ